MLIIKPYGRSVVKEGKAEQRKRQIIRRKGKKLEEAEPITGFVESHDEVVIAQWISVIDKIIAKPKDVKKPKENDQKYKEKKKQYDFMQKAEKLRKILGNAVWQKLEEKLAFTAEKQEEEKKKFKKIWDWKVEATQPKKPKDIKGRWYEIFVGDIECNEDNIRKNAAEIAAKIYNHLHVKAYRFPAKLDNGKVQKTPVYQNKNMGSPQLRCHNKGLIEHRACSIEKNVLKPAKQKAALYNEVDKETYIKKAGDIAGNIRKAILKEWKETDSRSTAQNARNDRQSRDSRQSLKPENRGRNLTEEGYKDRPYQIAVRELRGAWKQVFDGFKTFRATEAKNPSLLNLHLQIKETYKYLLKGRKKLDQKLETILPADNDALFRLMEARQKNRSVNHLIRLGKVIHYEASSAEQRDSVKSIVGFWPSKKQVEESCFWSSEGQTEIKQNEAFVRIWRGVLAFAARTLKDWADPQKGHGYSIPGDILINREEALCKFNVNDFDEKYKILFGNRSEEDISKLKEENDKKVLLEFSLKSISNLRNAAFHFKGMGTFIKELEKKTDETVSDILKNICKTDHEKHQDIQKKIMEGGHFHKFFGRGEIEKIWRELTSAKPSILPLPKLKRVLERAEDAWKGKDKLQLPSYSTSDEREACKWARCQYTATKLLYDGPFKNWLEEQQHAAISNYIKRALEHTTQAARRMNGKDKDKEHVDLITAKAKNIGELRDKEKFEDFFFKLTAATATEMRVQNFYQSDGNAAKKQAEYIEKFKCDVVALAFEEYLKEKIENAEIFCEQKRTEKQQENFDYKSLTSTQKIKEFEVWQAELYFLLHLVPVEDGGSLRQQLKKWEIVTRKSHGEEGREKDILKVLGVLDLYIAMHDAQFVQAELEALSEEDKKTAKVFFENENVFKEIFPNNPGGSEAEHLPIRGLREMQRFGRGILHNVYEKHKIMHDRVELWNELKNNIAEEQKRLKELHEEWVESNNKIKWTKKEEYKSALKKVEKHRHLTAQVMLQNHVRLHRLLMSILGRLVDFSGLWERDLYFILLALFYQNNVTNIKEQFRDKDNEIANDKHGVNFLKDGQIVEAFIKLKNDKLKGEVTRLLSIKGVDVSCKKAETENLSCEEKHRLLKEKDKLLKEQDPLVWIRNRFAHLAMLEKENLPVNLTKEVNKARQLMAYDRKLKNAVSKSIIDLLERENIKLKWCMGTGPHHKLEGISSLVSANAHHLKNKNIEEELCSPHFIAMVTSLFVEEEDQKNACEKRHNKNNEQKFSSQKAKNIDIIEV